MDELTKKSLKQEDTNEDENFKMPFIYYSYSSRASFELFQLSSHEYSKLTELNDFLLELTKYILRARKSENNSSNEEILVADFQETINEYISNYINGDFVLLKSFHFIQSTYLNRLCFISHFSKLFNLTSEGVHFNGKDYVQLIKLVCGDFPADLIIKAIRFILKEKKDDEEKNCKVIVPGKFFIKALFITLVFKEFLEESEKILYSNNSLENYSLNILRVYNNLKEKSLLEEFYGPPLGLLYSILVKISKKCNVWGSGKQILIFSRGDMNDIKSKVSLTIEVLIHEIINNEVFDKIVLERMGFFWQTEQDKRLEMMEDILNASSEANDESEENILENNV